MNYLLKYKRNYAWVFLAGYVLLFTYSAFHFHKIEIGNPYQYEQEDSARQGNKTHQLYSAFFTCQFSLVYNSLFVLDINNSSANRVEACKEFIKFGKREKVPTNHYFLTNLLRAPPSRFNS
ncbi:MAG: hypothetical protein R6W90_12655 [Ignavibacteriaceae bacterium]